MLSEQPSFDLNNPSLVLEHRPAEDISTEINPGGIKAVKTTNRRNDSVVWMKPSLITPYQGFNARFDTPKRQARVRKYADSMKREGFKPDKAISCVVEDDGQGGSRIVPYDGHTRLESVMLAISEGAKIEVVPVFLAPKTMSMDDMIKALHTNNNGTELTMLETALFVVKRLANRGFSQAEIAEHLQMTGTHVDNLMTLAGTPKSLQNMIISEQVSASVVVEQVKKHGMDKATALFKEQLAAALAQGKNRITNKNLPGAKFASALKRSAPRLFERVSSIRQDPGYAGLSDSTRQELEALVEELEVLRQGNEG